MFANKKNGLSRRDMLKAMAGGTGAVALGALPVASVMAQDPVTITYWHGWTEQWENYVQDIVDAFHAHQDAIRVEPLVVPYADFLVRLTAAIASGDPPDIVTFFGSNEIPGLASLGGITPYADLGTPEEIAAIKEFLTPAALAGGVVDGAVYGTPSGFGVYDLAWNKNQFEESGLDPEVGPGTIEELDAMAEQLTVEDDDGNLDRVGLLHLGAHASFHRAWFGNFGGQIYDAENDAITANHPGNVRALEWMMTYSERYGVDRLQRFQSGLSGERGGTQDPFIAGRLAMQLIGPWKLGDFHRFAADGFRWGLTHLPPVAGEEDSTGWGSWIWGNYQCIPTGAANPGRRLRIRQVVVRLHRSRCDGHRRRLEGHADHNHRLAGRVGSRPHHRPLRRSSRLSQFLRNHGQPARLDHADDPGRQLLHGPARLGNRPGFAAGEIGARRPRRRANRRRERVSAVLSRPPTPNPSPTWREGLLVARTSRCLVLNPSKNRRCCK